jgi:tRNA dimethylallyltransferase
MLYFRALQQGLARLPSADPELRQAMSDEASVVGWTAMHKRLARLDPEAARRIHPNDPQRIQRALEVQALTGRPMSELIRSDGDASPFPYRLLKLVRAPADRLVMRDRIEQRFRSMLNLGLIDEVAQLWARGDLTADMPSMRSVGYRQVLRYLEGSWTLEEMCQKGIIASRQLAKRQLTWLRAETHCHWLADRSDTASEATHQVTEAMRSRSA